MKYSKQDIEDKPFDFVYVDDFGINKKLESANATRPTIDQLSDNVLESLTGVTREWLSPVRPHFEKLAAMAMSKQVSDADFIEALEKSQRDIPELFDKLNVEALQTHMNDAIGTAMIAGSVERYEAGEVKAAYDPNQPRDPGGEGGGQWVSKSGGDDLGYDVFTPPKPKVIKLVGDSETEAWEKEAASKAISEIESLGFMNPLSPSEVVIDGNVKVDVRRQGADIWLKSIESIKQGKGKGTGVLNEIKTIATENGVDIWLNPEPIGNTSKEKLIKWYESNGFVDDGGGKWRFTPPNKLESSAIQAYDPSQKRAAKGEGNGGQWVSEGGVIDKLPKRIIDQAEKDKAKGSKLSHRLDQESMGVVAEMNNSLDRMFSKSKMEKNILFSTDELEEKAESAYLEFAETRRLLKDEYGERIKLYRFEANKEVWIKDKNTLNFFATKKGLSDWGEFHPDRELITKDVAIDDILAIQTTVGNYDELVVFNNDSTDLYKPKKRKLESSAVQAYDPSQKRGEAGTPQGGRWVKEDGAKSQKEKTIERFGDEASSMMRKLKENEGFTLNLDGTDELSGYAVSIDKSSERVFDELTEENIEDYIREFWDELTLEGRHLGGWYNKANNKIYLDVPIIVDDFDTATRLASENDQIAFFHLDTFTEYQTDEAIRQIKER